MRIVVVGGANGCGAAAVRAFVAEGADVVSLDVRDDDGRSVVDGANRTGPGRASYLHCDASIRADVREAFASAAGNLGGVDALLVPAAIQQHVEPELIDDDGWHRMIANDLRLVFVTNQEIFPHLVANGGGRILNFGSGAALIPYPDAAHYAAAKGGVLAWTRSIAHAWGRHNITANVVNASMAGTLMFDTEHKRLTDEDDPFGEHMEGVFPAGFPLGSRRFPPTDDDLTEDYGDPDTDLAPVLVFLVGEGARFITAQVISIDGGATPAR